MFINRSLDLNFEVAWVLSKDNSVKGVTQYVPFTTVKLHMPAEISDDDCTNVLSRVKLKMSLSIFNSVSWSLHQHI